MDDETEIVEATLPNGVIVGVEVAGDRGGNVGALDQLDFKQIEGAVDGLSQVVIGALRKSRPHRATAELGLNLKVEAGHLTAVLVKAGGNAALKVSLTWERSVDGSREGAGAGQGDGGGQEGAAAEPAEGDRAADDSEAE